MHLKKSYTFESFTKLDQITRLDRIKNVIQLTKLFVKIETSCLFSYWEFSKIVLTLYLKLSPET